MFTFYLYLAFIQTRNVKSLSNKHLRLTLLILMTNEAEQDLKACFDLTDWSVFEATATDLDELTETVTSYISFCEDICIPTRTFLSFNNDKPWFTGKLKQLRQAKEDAYRSGDKILYNQARNRLTKEIRVAKKNYSEKLKKELSANDPASVWTGLRNITMYKTPPPQSVENQQLADDLNVFYCRFEKARLTPSTRSDLHFTHSPTPPGLWMTLSIWDCITSCNTSTNLGITQGSYLWTSARPSIPSCLTFSQTN